MIPGVGAVADDFTGTASAGTILATSGVRTGLYLDAASLEEAIGKNLISNFDAVFVSTSTRNRDEAESYDIVSHATEVLQDHGIEHLSKKIDSTLRGNIGKEIDAMLDTIRPDAVAVVVPTMPASRRICVGGFSIIDGSLLTETSVARDPRRPVRSSYVPSIIESQTSRRVATITIETVSKGSAAIHQALEEQVSQGCRVIVVDAIHETHVLDIATACSGLTTNVLAVDPGAFTNALTTARGTARPGDSGHGPDAAREDPSAAQIGKPVLYLSGSANPNTGTQLDTLCRTYPDAVRISLSIDAVLGTDEAWSHEVSRVVERASEAVRAAPSPPAIIIDTLGRSGAGSLEARAESLGQDVETCARRITEAIGRTGSSLLSAVGAESFSGMVLTGGDTMESVCRILDTIQIRALGNIEPQLDVGVLETRTMSINIVTKGGFCCGPDAAVHAVDHLRNSSAALS